MSKEDVPLKNSKHLKAAGARDLPAASADSKAASGENIANEAVQAWKGPNEGSATKGTFEDKQAKAAQRDASSSSATSDSKAAQKESSSSSGGEKSAASQTTEKAVDSGKSQPADTSKPTRAVEQNTQTSERQERNAGTTGKQAEHISNTTQPEGRAKDESSGGGDNQERKGGAGGKSGGDVDAAPREKGPVVVAPEARGDAGSGRPSDPKGGGSDGSRSSDARPDPGKASDATRAPEARTADMPKSGDSQRPGDTARDGTSPRTGDVAKQEGPRDTTQRSDAKLPEGAAPKDLSGRPADQIVKTGDVAQDRTARQFEKDPLAAGKPTDAQAGKQIDQKIDGILLDGKQVGLGQQGRGQEKVDPKDTRLDAGQKIPDGRLDAGQKVPEARGDAGSRVGGGGGAEGRMDAGRRPGDARDGERIGIIGGDKGVAAGRLDVHISADAVKLHLPEKGGQEIILTDKNTQRTMNDAFGLFDRNEFKNIATNFKQQVDLWTELTSKQFNGLKDTIANVLDAPKATAVKELGAWAQDLTKRPDAQQVDVRQELGHAVKMQLLDSLKRNDDTDRRHADLKDRCVTLLDEFKQIKTDLQGRCEEAIKIARSFFTAPIERTPIVHIADSPTKKLTEAEIDELLNTRLREFTPPKSKDDETEKAQSDGDKSDDQAAAVQQAMQQASHTVKKGETVSMIAAKYCGTEECAVLIAEMNRGVISATYEKGNLVFHAPVGAVLTIPYDRDIREFKEKALGLAGNLPDGSQS